MRTQELNIPYGTHPHHMMDVYFPRQYTTDNPVVFIIHGGGFIAGLKEDFTTQAKLFCAEGFITINLSHRLIDITSINRPATPKATSIIRIADQLDDVSQAVKKYMNNAPTWGSGTSRMYMAGHSAGAILSLLYIHGPHNQDGHIRAAGNWAGVTDLSLLSNPAHSFFTLTQQTQIQALYHRAMGIPLTTHHTVDLKPISPYWVLFNSLTAHPVISIYPEHNSVLGLPGESIIGLELTRQYHTLLQKRHITEKLSIYKGANHSFTFPSHIWPRIIHETATWFQKH